VSGEGTENVPPGTKLSNGVLSRAIASVMNKLPERSSDYYALQQAMHSLTGVSDQVQHSVVKKASNLLDRGSCRGTSKGNMHVGTGITDLHQPRRKLDTVEDLLLNRWLEGIWERTNANSASN
jgi:hypothetical protein